MVLAATGLTGFIGSAIAARVLREPGMRVRALVRPGGRRHILLAAVPAAEIVEGDVADAAARQRLCEGADAVLHAAYDPVAPDAGRRFREDGEAFRRSYLDRNFHAHVELLAAAREAKARQFVFISSFSVYGRPPHEGLLTEESAIRPNNPYSSLKAACEAFALAYDRLFPEGVSILRPCLVYGIDPAPGQSTYGDLAAKIARGEPVEAAGGTATVGVSEVAEAAALALAKPAAARGLLNVVDRYTDQAEAAEILKRLARSPSEIRVASRRGEPATPVPSARARALGVRFPGRPGLEAYLGRLLEAARAEASGPAPAAIERARPAAP